jgi:uncharacterized protein YbjT (DUF2867 family)
MSILVTGGTGTVGTQVVRRLVELGQPPSVLLHSTEKAKFLPVGVQGVVGALDNPGSLAKAMQGFERVFLLTPLDPKEAEMGITAVKTAKAAGVRHLVYLSVHKVDAIPQIPHFQSKIEIEKAIKSASLAYTLLMPNNFYQNDEQFKQAILEYGVYPQPIGDIGLNRVDVRDIADAAVTALTQPGHAGKRYPLIGPDTLTGRAVADTYSRHLGRTIRYAGNDLAAWEAQALTMMPDWLVHDVKIMYQRFQRHGLVASKEDFAEQAKILGRPPRSFDAYVLELTTEWKRDMQN